VEDARLRILTYLEMEESLTIKDRVNSIKAQIFNPIEWGSNEGRPMDCLQDDKEA
jgi:hypothetical protein